MGLSGIAVPFISLSCFWGFVGVICPIFVPPGRNRGITQIVLMETAFCCYLFWLCTFLMQLNPLIGPDLTNLTIYVIQQQWADPFNYTTTSS